MKRFLLLAQLITFSVFSCKNDTVQAENKGLVGKWKLTEVLNDPGDGSGKFVKAGEASISIVEFKTNGDFTETRSLNASTLNPYNSYKILDDTRIEFTVKGDTVTRPPLIWTYKDLSSTTLTLGFGCDEPCLGKFVAIR